MCPSLTPIAQFWFIFPYFFLRIWCERVFVCNPSNKIGSYRYCSREPIGPRSSQALLATCNNTKWIRYKQNYGNGGLEKYCGRLLENMGAVFSFLLYQQRQSQRIFAQQLARIVCSVFIVSHLILARQATHCLHDMRQ